MKKIIFLLITATVCTIISCQNEELRKFDDFDYTTTYFPYQFPVRTLVLGDYMFDNLNDNNLKFKISARIGGVYDNKKNIKVSYELAPSLVTNLTTAPNLFDGKATSKADTLEVLPASYYTMSPANEFEIPAGSFNGGFDIQLKEEFLNDPKAVKTKFVIPVKITSSTTDSVLQGKTTLTSPDPRIAGNWVIAPKDYTIFGIKFVNKFHGKYLHRGASAITDTTTSTQLENIVYRTKYVENNEIWALQTIGRYSVTLTGTLRKSPSSPGKFAINLTFDSSDNCQIINVPGSLFKVRGTGKFVNDGDKWGNVPQDAIYLDYVVTEGKNKHEIKDTLVFRDKAVTFLEYVPVILP